MILAGLSFAWLWAGRASIPALAIGVAVLDAGQQSSHLANQSVIFGLSPEARNRLNAVYMVVFFIGGALGTLIGAWAWGAARWTGVCVAGGCLAAAGLVALWTMPAPSIKQP